MDAVVGLGQADARAVGALDDAFEALPVALDPGPCPRRGRLRVADAAGLGGSRSRQAGGAVG
jgi:hypothetical protein